jgi:hypothetical protein
MSFYAEMQAIAGTILTDFTQSTDATPIEHVTYLAPSGPPENPGERYPVVTRIDGTVSGVTADFLRDSLVKATDLVLTMPTNIGIVPLITDTFNVNNVSHTIISINPRPATGIPSVYKVVIRA